MMDYYLEFVFPEKNIRYIAVTENEDTKKGLSDFVPFKRPFIVIELSEAYMMTGCL